VAKRLGLAPLLRSLCAAFVHGMDLALVVSTGIALAGPVLALAFPPGRPATETATFEGPGRSVMERTGMKLPAIAVVEVTPVDRST
jgi:hypothetical protein